MKSSKNLSTNRRRKRPRNQPPRARPVKRNAMADLRLIYGFHAVTARIRQNPEGVLVDYLQAQRQDPSMRDLIKLAEANGVRIIPVEAARLDGMAGNARSQGVAAGVDASRRARHLEDALDTLADPPLLL